MRIVAETTSLKRKYEQEVALRPDFGFFDQIWVQDALHDHWAYLQDAQAKPSHSARLSRRRLQPDDSHSSASDTLYRGIP